MGFLNQTTKENETGPSAWFSFIPTRLTQRHKKQQCMTTEVQRRINFVYSELHGAAKISTRRRAALSSRQR